MRLFDEIDECAQMCGHKAPARIIEERAGKPQPPFFHNGHQISPIEMRPQPVLENIDHAGTGNGRVDAEISASTELHNEATLRIDDDIFPAAFEFPRWKGASRKAPEKAIICEQVAWVLGSAPCGKVLRRCGEGVSLLARADR